MNVSLKPELERFVTERVTAGQYADVNEMMNEAVLALKEQEKFEPEYEAYVRHEVGWAIEQMNRGEVSDFDAEKIIAEQRKRLSMKGAG